MASSQQAGVRFGARRHSEGEEGAAPDQLMQPAASGEPAKHAPGEDGTQPGRRARQYEVHGQPPRTTPGMPMITSTRLTAMAMATIRAAPLSVFARRDSTWPTCATINASSIVAGCSAR